MTDDEYAEWQQNYDEIVELAKRNRQAWIEFTRDPMNDGLRDAYLADLADPLLTAAEDVVTRYRNEGYFTEPGAVERQYLLEPLSVTFNDGYTSAHASACEIDGDRFLQAARDGDPVLLNEVVGRRMYRLEFDRMGDTWKLAGHTKTAEYPNETEC